MKNVTIKNTLLRTWVSRSETAYRPAHHRFYSSILALAGFMLLFSSSVFGAVKYVTVGGTGTGSSWASSFGSITTATADAVDGDEIWVRAGTYGPTAITKAVSVYGGFAGTETVLSQRDTLANKTIIDGGGTDTAVNITVGSGDSRLDGLTIQNGYAVFGGGVMVSAWGSTATVTIDRCIIAGNVATRIGGGIYFANGSLNVYNSIIHSNIADQEYNNGSGIYAYLTSGSAEIINSTIVNNSNSAGTGAGAAGVFFEYGTAVIHNSIIWANGKLDYLDEPGINDGTFQVDQRASTVTISYSNIQARGYGDYTTGVPDADHNMRRLPGFVDPVGVDGDADSWQDNDYHLAGGSFCIDYGNGDFASATDVYGNPRFDDLSIADSGNGTPTYTDIGAYEFQSSTPLRIYVDPGATGARTGESWADAVTSIHTGVAMAIDGAEVWVRGGTYLLDTSVVIEREAALYGGFAGTETTRLQRDWLANPTVLDGQHNDMSCVRILADATLDGFTVTGGYRLFGSPPDGGGIYAEEASPTIAHCIVHDNLASNGAGITIINGPNAVIDSCLIVDNYAKGTCGSNCGNGGGIYLYEYTDDPGNATITNSIIAGNRSDAVGGGIRSTSGLSVINSTIVNNKTDQIGGIVQYSFDAAPLVVTNSIVWGNIATSDYTNGKDQISSSTATITYSDVQDGDAGTGNIDLQPQFVDIGSWDDNGTPADITDDIWLGGNYHLQAISPGIDAGTVSGAPVLDIELNARPQGAGIDMGAYELIPFTVGGSLSGLTGGSVVLQNNGGDDLSVGSNGDFEFSIGLSDGDSYAVTVLTHPSSPVQRCSITSGSGTISSADVDDISVTCVAAYIVGGDVSGLETGNSVVLQNNAGDDLSVDANTSFTFPFAMEDTETYEVTILTQPSTPAQVCSVSNESGEIDGANISDVTVSCVTPFTLTYIEGLNGSISGDANQTVVSGEDGTEVTAVPDSGYQFQAWSDGVLAASRTDANVTADISVTAAFELNISPVITQGDAAILVTMDEDGTPVDFVLTLNASDANSNDTLSWSISNPAGSGSATASGTGASIVVNYAPESDFSGSDSFEVQVSDGVDQDTITVNITINPIDDAPILGNQVANQYVDEDAPDTVLDLSNTFSDVDSAITLSVLSNSNSSLLGATMVGTDLTLSYLQDQNGTADITIRATADGKTVNELFVVDVKPVNDAPVIPYGTMEFTDGVELVGQVKATDPDEGDTLTFLLMSSDDEHLFTLQGNGELSFNTPPDIKSPIDANVDNRYELTIQVYDGTVTSERAVTVLPGGCTFFILPVGNGRMAVICL